jgi:MtaA/CmuA family methyltransferase
MMDLLDEESEQGVHALIDYCRRACAVFALAQKEAGAHATSIGDAFAGPNLISPEMYRKFALEPEMRLTEEVQAAGIPFSIHICGNTNGIIADMGRTGAQILEVDWQLDMAEARRAVPASTVLMGNINPSAPMAFGTPEQVEAAVRGIMDATGGRGVFLSSGCAMGRNTKPENMRALMAAAEKFGRV